MKKTLFTLAFVAGLLSFHLQLLAQSVNCNLTLKTTIQGFKVYKHNPTGAIMFRAKFAIDADGSPRAYGPNNSGLDYTANAGSPGNWWGIVTNSNGTPYIQGSGDPYPGMYVSPTSLVNTAYPAKNPLRYVDSESIPFYVLPSAVTQLAGIKLGDVGYVYNTVTGQGCYAIFADGGPAGKLGEGSIYLADKLGVNSNARTGGTSQGIIDYIVFPNSGSGQGVHKTIAQIDAMGAAMIATVGGTGIVSCLNTNSCGTPLALSAGAITSSAATLNWSLVSGAGSYTIKYKAVSAVSWATITSATTSTLLNGLTAATAYEFKVQAVCSGAGSYSSVANFTTGSSGSPNPVITIGTGTNPYSAHPFGTIYMDERTQYIITKQELTAAGWSSASPYLSALAFNVTNAASQAMNTFTISIAHVSASSFGNTTFISGTNSTLVYSGTATATVGWNTYTFNTPFAYNGTGNLLISICWNNSSFTANSSVQSHSYPNYVALYHRADLTNSGVCSRSTGTRSYYRPNTRLTFSSSPGMQIAGEDAIRSIGIENKESVGAIGLPELQLFPNPSDGTVLYGKLINSDGGIASNETDKAIRIMLYDMLGRVVFSNEISVQKGVFSVSFHEQQLQQGMYMVSGVMEDRRFTKTILVK